MGYPLSHSPSVDSITSDSIKLHALSSRTLFSIKNLQKYHLGIGESTSIENHFARPFLTPVPLEDGFKLKNFHFDGDNSLSLIRFIKSQPSITEFVASNCFPPNKLGDALLPNVTTLSGSAELVYRAVAGRPVSTVCCADHLDHERVPEILAKLGQSTACIKTLKLPITNARTASDMMPLIAHTLPSISSLYIPCRIPQDKTVSLSFSLKLYIVPTLISDLDQDPYPVYLEEQFISGLSAFDALEHVTVSTIDASMLVPGLAGSIDGMVGFSATIGPNGLVLGGALGGPNPLVGGAGGAPAAPGGALAGGPGAGGLFQHLLNLLPPDIGGNPPPPPNNLNGNGAAPVLPAEQAPNVNGNPPFPFAPNPNEPDEFMDLMIEDDDMPPPLLPLGFFQQGAQGFPNFPPMDDDDDFQGGDGFVPQAQPIPPNFNFDNIQNPVHPPDMHPHDGPPPGFLAQMFGQGAGGAGAAGAFPMPMPMPIPFPVPGGFGMDFLVMNNGAPPHPPANPAVPAGVPAPAPQPTTPAANVNPAPVDAANPNVNANPIPAPLPAANPFSNFFNQLINQALGANIGVGVAGGAPVPASTLR